MSCLRGLDVFRLDIQKMDTLPRRLWMEFKGIQPGSICILIHKYMRAYLISPRDIQRPFYFICIFEKAIDFIYVIPSSRVFISINILMLSYPLHLKKKKKLQLRYSFFFNKNVVSPSTGFFSYGLIVINKCSIDHSTILRYELSNANRISKHILL